MKQSPFEKELVNNLGPSKFSAEGFLGFDQRPLDEIIHEDLRYLESAHVSKESLLEVLRQAYEKARQAFGAPVVLLPGVTAVFYESMGRVPSPFHGDGVFEKGEAIIHDEKRDLTIIATPLGLHLIEKYGFFQGKGSRYRIEPHRVIKTFGLQSQGD